MNLKHSDCDEVRNKTISTSKNMSWCGFCFRQYTEAKTSQNSEGEGNGSNILDNRNSLSLFFKLLGRYISLESTEKNSPFQVDIFGLGFEFGSCEDCSCLLEDFCLFYNEIKLLEMKINGKLETLCAIINSADKVSSRIRIVQEILLEENKSLEHLQLLRKEVLKRVSDKLKAALPKVRIKRKRVCNNQDVNQNVSPNKQLEKDLGKKVGNSEDIKLEILEPFISKQESVEESVSESNETEKLEECPERKIKTDTILHNYIEYVAERTFQSEFEEDYQNQDSTISQISAEQSVPQMPLSENSNGEENTSSVDDGSSSRILDCVTDIDSNILCHSQYKRNDKVSRVEMSEDEVGEPEMIVPLNNLGLQSQSQSFAESLDPDANQQENLQNENNRSTPEAIFDEFNMEGEVAFEDSQLVSKDVNLNSAEAIVTTLESVPEPERLKAEKNSYVRRSKRKSISKNEVKEEPSEDNDISPKLLKRKGGGGKVHCRCTKCKELVQSNLPPLHTGEGSNWLSDITLSPEAHKLFGSMKKCKVKNCNKEYFTESGLIVHKNLHGKFKCNVCEIVSDYAPKLVFHEMTHVSDSKESLLCPRCPYATKLKRNLCSHFIETHLAMPSDYHKCPICGNQFHSTSQRIFRKSFRIHLQTAHDFKKKFYRCKENGCLAYFNLKFQLLTHQAEHFLVKSRETGVDGKKLIECMKCKRKFANIKLALRHYREIHMRDAVNIEDEDESCVCHQCGKTLKNPSGLVTHVLRVHSTNPPVNVKSKKNYICETCGRQYKSSAILARHMLAHTGPESWLFECSVCRKRCMTQNKLDEHMRTHSNEKPFSCECCGARYAHRHNLRIHINSKHGDITTDTPRKMDKASLIFRKRIDYKKSNPANVSSKGGKLSKQRKQRRAPSSDSDSSLSD